MTTNLETLKMSAIQKGIVISYCINHLKAFTAQTANKGTVNTNLPSLYHRTNLTASSIGAEPTIRIHCINKFRSRY